jgi:threonine-phosphate decarboxylase
MRKIPTPADLERLFRHGDRTAADPGVEVNFSVSVNPLGPPRSPLTAIVDNLLPPDHGGIARYPDPECRSLAERLAWRHGVTAEQIIVGNGANDLIYVATRALKPKRVAIVEPTYTEYLRASRLSGAAIEHWLPENDGFAPASFDPEEADLVWVCNPNNPTGRLWPPANLRSWVAGHPRSNFIVDEAFLPFRDDEADHSLIPVADQLANLIVLRSLTKVYALAGLRLGYAVTNPELAARLREQLVPWSVNALAQVAGVAALDDEPFLQQTRAWLRDNLGPFTAQLAACSSCLQPLASDANFVLVRLKGASAGWLCQRLLERGLAVRDASNFVGLGSEYIRISLRKPEENARLLRELRLVFLEG